MSAASHSSFAPFFRARKESRILSLLAVPLLCGMIVLCWLPSTRASFDSDEERVWVCSVLTVLLAGVSWWLLHSAFARLPGLDVLSDQPASVVWVYPERIYLNGLHALTKISLGVEAGRRVRLSVLAADEAAGLAVVRAACPGARVGYSAELEAQFKRDPRSLRERKQTDAGRPSRSNRLLPKVGRALAGVVRLCGLSLATLYACAKLGVGSLADVWDRTFPEVGGQLSLPFAFGLAFALSILLGSANRFLASRGGDTPRWEGLRLMLARYALFFDVLAAIVLLFCFQALAVTLLD